MSRTPLRLGALAVALASFVGSATVVVYETLDDMARRVPLIVRGKVARNVSGWDDNHRRIWTWTELVVSDTVKGAPSKLVMVKQPGGEADGIGQAVAGVATFREGEDCILFLEPAPDEKGVWRVSGLSAGKVQVASDQGKTVAMRVVDGLSFAAPAGKKVAPVVPRELLGTPEQLIARLRAANATGGKR